ncbi:MAG: hypothetical protein OSB25_02605 [Salibacteraceae bacterium]|nr:hypothetical protein [Salibacteraceae bacterium]|tara:strand:- start:35646 stop:37391 length:1746 start_codon:yes stop_codon:yes gene_type:complete
MNKTLVFIIFAVIFNFGAYAQRSDEDTLKSGDVYIVREYQPKISDAFKLSNNPKVLDTIININQQAAYNVKDVQAETEFQTEPIKPAKMKGEPLSKLYRAYVLLGAGNNLSTRGEFVLNSIRSRKWDYGLKAWHHGSNGNVPERGASNFSDNKIDLYGKKFFYNKILSANLNYGLNTLHYYGFDEALFPDIILENELSKDNIATSYQNIAPEVNFKTYFKDSTAINSEFNLKFTNYTNRANSIENNIRLDLDLDRYYDDNFAQLGLFLDYNQFRFDPLVGGIIPEFSNTIFGFKPQVTAGQNKWKVTVGIEGNISSDTLTDFNIYPHLYAKYDLVEGLLIPYLGLRGGLERNNFKSLTQVNPYVREDILTNNRNNRVEVYGGIRGQFSSNSSYNVTMSHKIVDNMPLFVNDSTFYGTVSANNQFGVVYDNVQITQIGAEFGLQKINKFNGLIRGDYFVYNLENQKSAWNMPDFKVTLSGWYDISDKLVFTADIIAVSTRSSFSINPNDGYDLGGGIYSKQLDGLVDLNLGIEYFFTKRFTAFIRSYNLANQNYQFYNQYNTQGITIIGGISYSFWGNRKGK